MEYNVTLEDLRAALIGCKWFMEVEWPVFGFNISLWDIMIGGLIIEIFKDAFSEILDFY